MSTANQREDNRRSQNRAKSVRPQRRNDEILTEWRGSQRAYRERRHRYVATLETQVDAAATQNETLREENDDLAERLLRLRAQNLDIHAASPQGRVWDEGHAGPAHAMNVGASRQGQSTGLVPHQTHRGKPPFERSREARVSYAAVIAGFQIDYLRDVIWKDVPPGSELYEAYLRALIEKNATGLSAHRWHRSESF